MHSEDAELWTAARTVDQHAAGDGCAQCSPGGSECRLYRWATTRLQAWESEHGRYPHRAPAWSSVSRLQL